MRTQTFSCILVVQRLLPQIPEEKRSYALTQGLLQDPQCGALVVMQLLRVVLPLDLEKTVQSLIVYKCMVTA